MPDAKVNQLGRTIIHDKTLATLYPQSLAINLLKGDLHQLSLHLADVFPKNKSLADKAAHSALTMAADLLTATVSRRLFVFTNEAQDVSDAATQCSLIAATGAKAHVRI